MSKFDDLLALANSYATARADARSGHITYDEAADVGDELRTTIYALEDEYRALMDDQEELVKVKAELAAIRALEPVAWHTENHLTDRSATTYDKNVMYRWQSKGWPITPLYALPEQKK